MEKTRTGSIPEGSLIAYMSGLVKQFGGINLAQGIPGFPPPEELLRSLASLVPENLHQYPNGNGNPQLIQQIQDHYQKAGGINSKNILIVQGATEGISLIYLYLNQLLGGNWNSLAFDPIYESYAHLPGIFGNALIRFQYQEDGTIDWNGLEQAVNQQKVKLVFVNSPGNPYGRIWSREELTRMMVLAEKLDFFVLFDAVYEELWFTGAAPYNPLEQLSDRLFYVNSFSKALSITGWRIGYLIGSAFRMQGIRKIHDYTGLCAPSLLQAAVARYLQKDPFGSNYLLELRSLLKNSRDYLSSELLKLGFQFKPVSAGYFIWAQLPAGHTDGMEFCLQLYDSQKVAMVPGIHFSETGHAFVRINFAREIAELEIAIARIRTFLGA